MEKHIQNGWSLKTKEAEIEYTFKVKEFIPKKKY